MDAIVRQPLKRAAEEDRAIVIGCLGHHAGWATGTAFVEPWNWCHANCDLITIPDRKDVPSAQGSLWDFDESTWRINMVPELARRHSLELHRLSLYPGQQFNDELLRLIREVKRRHPRRKVSILSSTFRGIFREEAIEEVEGRAYNIHPTGIPVDREGRALVCWPQPLFEGKQAVELMLEMGENFLNGESEYDCPAMEWVIHKILPPPLIDRGRFLGANQLPIPLPHQEQTRRERRKAFNGVQSHCSAFLPALLHAFGPHLFAGAEPPWGDPRALNLAAHLPDPSQPLAPVAEDVAASGERGGRGDGQRKKKGKRRKRRKEK